MTGPGLHEVRFEDSVVSLGLKLGELVLATAVDVVQHALSRESHETPGERGDRKINESLAAAGVLATARSFGLR